MKNYKCHDSYTLPCWQVCCSKFVIVKLLYDRSLHKGYRIVFRDNAKDQLHGTIDCAGEF